MLLTCSLFHDVGGGLRIYMATEKQWPHQEKHQHYNHLKQIQKHTGLILSVLLSARSYFNQFDIYTKFTTSSVGPVTALLKEQGIFHRFGI